MSLRFGYRILAPSNPPGMRLAVADAMQLCYDCFPGDLLLSADGVDFGVDWGWVPVLDFALAMNDIADTLQTSRRAVFEFTETDGGIAFTRRGDRVKIEPTYVDVSVEVMVDEVRGAAHDMLREVRQEIEAAHPELLDSRRYRALVDRYPSSA
ncbi:hypothetical protein [Microbacterium maritypicum]